MSDDTAPPTTPDTVPVRRFWPLLPVAVALAVVLGLWWPDGPLPLRGLLGTAAMLATATVVVLLDTRRRR